MKDIKTLDKVKIGQKALVLHIDNKNPTITHRLACFCVLPETIIEVKGFAPFGNPMCIQIENTLLALRLSEAKLITVEILDNEKEK